MLTIKYNELTGKQQQDLNEKIENTIIKELFQPRKPEIVRFFEQVLSLDENVQLVKYPERLEVIDMYYYANCPLAYLMIQPSSEFCHVNNFIAETTLSLEPYDYEDINAIVLYILEVNNIVLEENMDTESILDTKTDLERNFLITCWKEAKNKYPSSKIKAFGMASDASGYTFDMENGNKVPTENQNPEIEAYLNNVNIYPTKALLNDQ